MPGRCYRQSALPAARATRAPPVARANAGLGRALPQVAVAVGEQARAGLVPGVPASDSRLARRPFPASRTLRKRRIAWRSRYLVARYTCTHARMHARMHTHRSRGARGSRLPACLDAALFDLVSPGRAHVLLVFVGGQAAHAPPARLEPRALHGRSHRSGRLARAFLATHSPAHLCTHTQRADADDIQMHMASRYTCVYICMFYM